MVYLSEIQLDASWGFRLPPGAVQKIISKEFKTFESAERSARSLHRRYGVPASIWQRWDVPAGRSGHTRWDMRQIAQVSTDALDRVWVDILVWDIYKHTTPRG
jgi:hypothetical protein